MSDGPHRSLKMRPGWKKVAKFADMRAASADEVGHAVAAAFSDDWRADVPANVAECICEVLGGQKDSLFRDQKVIQLEALRPLTAGRELAQILLDCASSALSAARPAPMLLSKRGRTLSISGEPAKAVMPRNIIAGNRRSVVPATSAAGLRKESAERRALPSRDSS
jgi:hypothetical protein